MKRLALAAAGVLVLAFLVDQTLQRARIDHFVEVLDRDPVAAAAQLAAGAERNCPRGDGEADYFRLAQALFAVETLARSRSEAIVERVVTEAFLAFGATGPDFSIGEGQIRISLLRKALAEFPASERKTNGEFHGAVRALFQRCRALDLAVLIIRHHVKLGSTDNALLARAQILHAARFWNGQTDPQSKEAFIAGRRYQELVYRTVMALRFGSNREAGKGAPSS